MIFGLDCHNPFCRHDTVTSIRLRSQLLRHERCNGCNATGRTIEVRELPGQPPSKWLECPGSCIDRNGRRLRWQTVFFAECRDMVFREWQKDSLFAQLDRLKVKSHQIPGRFWVEDENDVPPMAKGRLVTVLFERMPKSAIYFRWRPEKGEILSPDRIFQGVFSSGSSLSERKSAPYMTITPEQCATIMSIAEQQNGAIERVAGLSNLYCQHCKEQLPLKAFVTTSLREVSYGE